MNEYVITTIFTAVSGLAGWFVSRKQSQVEINKLKAEVNGNELDNVEKAIKIYRDLSEDLSSKLKSLSEKCDLLQEEIDKLIVENKSLKIQIESLTSTIGKMG